MDSILQIEMLDDGERVGSIMVHIVPVNHLGRAPMTTAVMSDDAIALGEEEQHLRIPVVRRKRPAVVEDDRLCVLWTPILIEDFDALLGGDRALGNLRGSLRFWGREIFRNCRDL